MVRPKSTSSGRELALEASPGARALLAEITAYPSAPLAVAVVGPGGTGKSAVVDAVEDAYRTAGVDVVRLDARRRQLPSLDATAAVLVDGAHRLEPAVLDELHALVDSPDARVVVAYRPWPRSRVLSELVTSLSRRRAPVVVGHLPRSAVKSRVAARLGSTPPDELVELVLEQSGGLPALADLVTQAMVDTGRFDPAHPGRFRRPDRINLSANAAERLRPQVEALDPAVHNLLEAMAVGAALDADMLCALLGTDPDDLVDVVEAGRATGLLTDDGELIPLIRSLVLRLMPVLRSRTMQQRLAALQLDRGGSVLAAGRQLLGTGASGSLVAAVLEAAADVSCASTPPSPLSCSPPARAHPASCAVSCSSTHPDRGWVGRLAVHDLIQVHGLLGHYVGHRVLPPSIGVTPLFLQSPPVPWAREELRLKPADGERS